MALPKLFQRIFWHNNTTPALNESNLNAMSKGIDDIDNRVIQIAGDVVQAVADATTAATNAATSAAAAASSAGSAATSATNAGAEALKSEGYATGKQNGSDVGSGSPYYENNAEYYADEAAGSATSAEAAAQTAQESVSHPPYIGANGDWYVYNAQTGQYQDSEISASVSVTVGTTSTLPAGSDASVTNTGTAANPVLNFGIPQGPQGTQGNPGPDGVSPQVTITTITGGHTVTIIDADHPSGQSFNVMDGAGSGDMQASVYDPQGAVASDGGIPSYVGGQITGKMDKANPTGTGTLSLNRKANTSIGQKSVAIGNECEASGDYSHAEGYNTTASGGYGAHAEGSQTTASAFYSHAEGSNTQANGWASHAGGESNIAGYNHQMVVGEYNSNKSTTLFEVGNGTGTFSEYRSNAFEVYDDGSLSTDNGTTKTKLPVIRSATLAANATQVIISNVPNTGTNLIEFYTSVPGLDYTAISVSGTDVTLTYDAQATATTVYAVITEVTS